MMKIVKIEQNWKDIVMHETTKVDKNLQKLDRSVLDQSNPYVGLLVRNFPALRTSNQSNPSNSNQSQTRTSFSVSVNKQSNQSKSNYCSP